MSVLVQAIEEAIEAAVAKNPWTGIEVEGGYEGTLTSIDIDSIEIETCELESGELTVIAKGEGEIFHKDADSEAHTEEHHVSVAARVSIDATRTSSGRLTVEVSATVRGASRHAE
jgi:hypothetical protein